MTKTLKTVLIVSAAAILLGGIIFLIAFAAGGFRINGLSSAVTQNKLYTESSDNVINSITVDYENADVSVVFGDALSVSYPELYTKGGEPISDIFLSDNGGNLLIRERILHFKNIGFNATEPKITVTLPRGRALNLNVETDNGDVTLAGGELTVGNLIINTDNGEIEVKDISAAKINLSSDNGSIEVANISVADHVKLEVENGEIDFDGNVTAARVEAEVENGDISYERGVISADAVNLSVSVGEIEAKLAGSLEDYTVRVEKGLGSSNIKTAPGGSKSLEIECEIGDIKILFENN